MSISSRWAYCRTVRLLSCRAMDVAALVISGLAAVAAVLSWLASRQSADAAENSASHAAEVARIERERRHDERQPEFEVSGSEGGGLIEFTLTITGPERSYHVSIEVIDGSVVPAIRTDRNGPNSLQVLPLGEVSVGVAAEFFGHPAEGTRGQDQRLLLTFESAEAEWQIFRAFPISWSPRVHFL